jgi:uncharacterized coiled-coil protein SlyX
MEHTVVPYLRSQTKAAQEHHITELNQLLTELHEAKKFMNRQAQYLDGLKSDVHWLTVQNQQLSDVLVGMSKERTEQYNLNKKRLFVISKHAAKQQQKKKQVMDDDASDTISYSSLSTISYYDGENNAGEQHRNNSSSNVTTPCKSL